MDPLVAATRPREALDDAGTRRTGGPRMPEGLARTVFAPAADPLAEALVVDVETQSLLELPKVGTHRYANHPSTRLLVAAFGFVNSNADPEVWLPGTPLPPAAHAHLMCGGMVAAWNAAFDVAIL